MNMVTKLMFSVMAVSLPVQPSLAFDMQTVKDFVYASAHQVTQSISNNKLAYLVGASAVGAACGLGWYFYRSKKNTPKNVPASASHLVAQPALSSVPVSVITSDQDKQLRPPFSTIVNSSDLEREFNEIIKNEADIKNKVVTVGGLLKEGQLEAALKVLESLKDEKEIQTSFGRMFGADAFSMYFEAFYKKLKIQVEACKKRDCRVPCGLINNNNSCFMNAAIQCLYSLEDINTALINYSHYNPESLAQEYVRFIESLNNESSSVMNPLSVCEAGWKLLGEGSKTQQDSSEFVQRFVEDLIKNNGNLSNLLNITISENTCDCQGNVIVEEQCNTWPVLPPLIINNDHKTLGDCVRDYFGIDKHLSRKNRLERASKYVMVRLNRSRFDFKVRKPIKIEQPISFELDNFDMNQLGIASFNVPSYRCKSLILHSGNVESGHYVAFVRKGDVWFLCDDDSVTRMDNNAMQDIARKGVFQEFVPVMFFYEKN